VSLFFQHLKQRKMTQWVIAYLAGAWLFLEVFGFVADHFAWQAIIVQGATITLGMGLLVVLVLAWFHGEKGRQGLVLIEGILLAAIIFATLAILFVLKPAESTQGPEPGLLSPVANELVDRSIAVLPFENRSGQDEDAYFTAGIHSEILGRLAKMSTLRVISRTSVMQFQSSSIDLHTIGRQLGVRYVLEGGIQRAGSQVRIISRLIDVENDRHVWAETYDRKLTVSNLFDIQSEVSKAIAQALGLNLSPHELQDLTASYTDSLGAYDLYLKAKHLQDQLIEESLWNSIQLLGDATAADPNFARAYATLGETYLWLGHGFGSIRPLDVYEHARTAASMALALDEKSSEAHMTFGHLAWEADWNASAAELHLRRAIELNHSSAEAHNVFGFFLLQQKRPEEAKEHFATAFALDPLSARMSREIAEPFRLTGDYENAIAQYQRTLRLHPEDWVAYMRLGRSYLAQGKVKKAIDNFISAQAINPTSARNRAFLGYAYTVAGEHSRARVILEELIAESRAGYIWPLAPALVYAGLRERDKALEWLKIAFEERITQLPWLEASYPELGPLQDEPVFQSIVDQVNGRGR
jgi:TolB-like protein/Flp pilus assembly protein TadD